MYIVHVTCLDMAQPDALPSPGSSYDDLSTLLAKDLFHLLTGAMSATMVSPQNLILSVGHPGTSWMLTCSAMGGLE